MHKIKNIFVALLIATLINTGFLAFLTFDKVKDNFQNRPVVISKQYDKGQSYEKALATEKPMIVWFYTDWCRYCQKFAPTFKKLTNKKSIKKAYAVAYVNAEKSANAELVKEYSVQGYPTVYIVKNGKKELIAPEKLFSYDALEDLEAEFLEFIK